MSWHREQWEMAGVWLTAISTSGLWWYTAQLFRTTARAAEAVPNIERAYVYLNVDWSPVRIVENGEEAIVTVRFIAKNYGRTPARVEDITYLAVCANSPPDEIPNQANIFDLVKVNDVLGAGENTEYLEGTASMPRDLYWRVRGVTGVARLNLYIVGWCTFYDVLGKRRETTFCYQQVENDVGLCHLSDLNRFEQEKPRGISMSKHINWLKRRRS